MAGRALREKGPDQLGVSELMRSAGLTHGGFYAHFKSKDALLAEALE
ncbi:MAG TPA: helix-turn-helix domain-containing protein, partial [Steroidobacteraceae bacterium]|nr:helix-turn-helix domain-containing protein [Steroidobacteraceae bacterium]